MIKHTALLLAFTAAMSGQVVIETPVATDLNAPTPEPVQTLGLTVPALDALIKSLDHAIVLIQRGRRLQSSVDHRDGATPAEVTANRTVFNEAELELIAQRDYWVATKEMMVAPVQK